MDVVVDAENVRRSVWPNIGREQLVELCRAWAEESGRRAVVVFDGAAPGGLESGPACVVVGAGGSADDWIADAVGPYWLVTSDRALRERATGAVRTLGGGAFARELTRSGASDPRSSSAPPPG